ncbi:capsule biosynthesis protein [Methylobacterium symbioticum]|jgi:capsular polysaccharide transport system permease protein|uniref:Capsule biosynthesis protein n=1 Tax=Methylobacterium symbioticum TaxID=2584084 RepID=A0A509EKF1_9HYPH|nr:capsule biosynthesis protein [Methylobacterium symbioticum]VUD73865.1 hypothetical protein MET9862_04486 [Methylobacterium symbioticum]
MSVEDVKQSDRVRGIIDFAQRSLTEVRRGAQTIEPIPSQRSRALARRVRERLAWTRLPGLRPADAAPVSYARMVVWRFATFVLLPTAVVAVYLFVFASDQYIAEARFAVRGNVEPMEDVGLGEYSTMIHKHNSQDSYIVRDFIRSRALVEEMEKKRQISQLFSRPEADFWTRFDPKEPVEELTKYWRRHVEANIDAISGVTQLTVRAFTPQDALTIAQDIVARAETLINEINKNAKADMLAQAKVDAETAQVRLRNAYMALQSFRNRWGIIDPIKSAESTMTTLLSLRKEKFKNENDLQVLRASNLDEKSRSIQVLVANVAAVDHQIKDLQEQLTRDGLNSDGTPTMANALLEYEGLVVERTIAEKLNESAINLLDRARVSADKQQIFLAIFVPPVLPLDTLYPMRWHALFVAFFCFLVVWSSVSLVVAGVRDQRL